MGRFVTIIGILGVFYLIFRGGSGGKEEMSNRPISDPTPVAAIAPEQRIRVVLFTGTEWCGACTHLDSTVITTPAWTEFAAKEISFRKVDVPADRTRTSDGDRALLSRYGVRGYPTMVVLDGKGKELSRHVGSGHPPENYKEWIRRHARFYRPNS